MSNVLITKIIIDDYVDLEMCKNAEPCITYTIPEVEFVEMAVMLLYTIETNHESAFSFTISGSQKSVEEFYYLISSHSEEFKDL